MNRAHQVRLDRPRGIETPDDAIDEDERELLSELDRRAADLKAGKATARPVDEVFKELREEGRKAEN